MARAARDRAAAMAAPDAWPSEPRSASPPRWRVPQPWTGSKRLGELARRVDVALEAPDSERGADGTARPGSLRRVRAPSCSPWRCSRCSPRPPRRRARRRRAAGRSACRSTTRGATAGTLPLAYAVLPGDRAADGHDRLPHRRAGRAGRALRDERRGGSSPAARPTHDIVLVDQRGTGDSGDTRCGILEFSGRLREEARRQAAVPDTAETARDIEDLRAALGAGAHHAARRLLRDEGRAASTRAASRSGRRR